MIEKYRGEILKALPPGNPGGSAFFWIISVKIGCSVSCHIKILGNESCWNAELLKIRIQSVLCQWMIFTIYQENL